MYAFYIYIYNTGQFMPIPYSTPKSALSPPKSPSSNGSTFPLRLHV